MRLAPLSLTSGPALMSVPLLKGLEPSFIDELALRVECAASPPPSMVN